MRNKYIYMTVVSIMLVLTFACAEAGATGGPAMNTGDKARIAEQYGLELPVPATPGVSGLDVGMSSPADILIILCRFLVNPLAFTIHEIL